MKRVFTFSATIVVFALALSGVASASGHGGGHGHGRGDGGAQTGWQQPSAPDSAQQTQPSDDSRGNGRGPSPTPPAKNPGPTPSPAQQSQQGDVELNSFSGDLRISGYGTFIGTLGNGAVQLSVSSAGQVSLAGAGCSSRPGRDGGGYFCRGSNIRVSVLGASYTISISGANVNVSAVGSGSATLRGAGGVRLNGVPQPLPSRGYLNLRF